MPTSQQIRDALQTVRDQPSFIQNLLINTLDWQIPGGIERIEDISYGWALEELKATNLNQHIVDGRIYQIQPIRADQPWGIFLLEFSNHDAFLSGRGLKGALRKILRALVPKEEHKVKDLSGIVNLFCLFAHIITNILHSHTSKNQSLPAFQNLWLLSGGDMMYLQERRMKISFIFGGLIMIQRPRSGYKNGPMPLMLKKSQINFMTIMNLSLKICRNKLSS